MEWSEAAEYEITKKKKQTKKMSSHVTSKDVLDLHTDADLIRECVSFPVV